MTALARIERTPEPATNAWVELVRPAAELATSICATEFVPKEMRNRPEVIAACILFGAELGLGPMVSLSKIAVVQGRPAPYAELARALALGAGHEIWVDEQTNTRCTVKGRRRNSTQVFSVTWTGDDVKRAGISNQNYAKYPRQMLLARASAELVRQMCPDVLGGITMFAEEVGDTETDTTTPAEAPKATRRRTSPVVPAEPAEAPTLPDDEPDPTPAATGPSDAQMRKMMACFNDAGLADREDRLAFTSAVVERDIATAKDLTADEARRVIDVLEQRISHNQPPLPDD